MLYVIAVLMACVLFGLLWICTKKQLSRNTEITETQRLAVDYLNRISEPEISSSGSRSQRLVVETSSRVSAMMEVDDITGNVLIRKVEEKNKAVMENQELKSRLIALEEQFAASNLKLQDLQNVHEEIVGRHEIVIESYRRSLCELEEKNLRLLHNESSLRVTIQELQNVNERNEIELEVNRRVIWDLEENCLRFKYYDSGLRRIIKDKDRLLASKEKEFAAQIDRYMKSTEDLLDRVVHIDRMKEEALQNLAAAQVKPETCDVGCGGDEPLVSTDFDPTVVTVCSPSEPDDAKEQVKVIDDDSDEEEEAEAPPCTSTDDLECTENAAEEESGEEEDLFFEPDWYVVDKYMYERGWRLAGMHYPGKETQPPSPPVKVMQPPLVQSLQQADNQPKIQPPSEIVNQFYPAESLSSVDVNVTCAVMEQLFPSSRRLEETSQPALVQPVLVEQQQSASFDVTSAVMEDLFPSSPPLEQSCQPLPVQDTSPTITSTPAKEYYIMSEIMQTVRNDDIVVNGIASSDSGRVVGRGGQNVDRIENEYGVTMTLNNGTLVISGGNAEKRLAAAGDVIDNLPVVIECPKLPLGDEIRIKTRHIKYYNHEYQVKICRPLDGKKNGTIWGRIENCRTVYNLLKKRFCKMSG
jgi:hypothetical protein